MNILYKKNSFSIKILISNMIFIATLIGILFFVFIGYYVHEQDEKMQQQLKVTLQDMKNNTENSIAMLETAALQLSTNPYIVDTMDDIYNHGNKKENYFDNHLIVSSKVYSFLWSYILEQDNISRISIYNNFGDSIYTGEALAEYENTSYIDLDYIDKIKKEFIKTRHYDLILNKINGVYKNNTLRTLAVVRQIKNEYLTYEKNIGYVEIEIVINQLEYKLKNSMNKEYTFIIYDLENEQVLGSSYPNLTENTQQNYITFAKNHGLLNYYTSKDSLDKYGIGIIIFHSKDDQTRFILRIILLMLIMYAGLFVLVTGIQIKITSDLTKPLIQLCESVKYETSFTNETKLVLNQGENEIGILSDAFDAMLLRLEKTMQNVVDAKTGEVKAQLFALQAQMNPHFIHNTIAIIQSYALDEDYDTILKISESLSDLIRYSSEFTDEKVPLIDELKHVENYMDLVKLRYEEGINFKFEIEGKIENIFVPRFIVQPILENSLEHGLKSKHFPWEIRVSCFIKNDYWKVEIKDNGIGMSQDAIKRIYLYVDNMKKEDNKIINENLKIGGLSMKNIVTRLFLEYKCNMIFKIDSAQNSYTIITIGGKFK